MRKMVMFTLIIFGMFFVVSATLSNAGLSKESNSSLSLDFNQSSSMEVFGREWKDTIVANKSSSTSLDSASVSRDSIKYGIVIEEPVKVQEKVSITSKKSGLSLEIPVTATNISVITYTNKTPSTLDAKDYTITNSSKSRTGEVVNKTLNITASIDEALVEYYTDAPNFNTTHKEYGKEVNVYSNTHYEEILSYMTIPLSDPDSIAVYWSVNDTKIPLSHTIKTDYDGNAYYVEWFIPHLSNETFDVNFTVINPQSYPYVGGNWTVYFLTNGTANLTIEGYNGTYFGVDFDFQDLWCGDTVLNSSYSNNTVFYENYNCSEVGHETSRIITPGVHTLKFTFGDLINYAYNDATTNS